MTKSALEVQRYDLDLMTPIERAAFERTLSSSQDLQKEFWSAGDALSGLYTRLAEGMPEPRKELKDILLSKIADNSSNDRAAIISGGALGMIPSALSDGAVGGGISSENSFPKKVLTILAIATIGIVSLFGITNLISNQNPKTPIVSANANNYQAPENTAEIKQNTPLQNINAMSTELPKTPAAISKHSSILLNNMQGSIPREQTNLPILPIKDNVNENPRVMEDRWVPIPLDPITPTSLFLPIQNNDIANPFDRQQFVPENDLLESESRGRWSFSVMQMSTLKFYPGREEMATPPPLNTFGAAIKYELTPFVAVGLESGIESFPLYRGRAQGGYDEFYSITWGGASVTVSDPFLEVLNCVPEARFVAGICTGGPMAKLSTGFAWQASSRIALSPEIEYTGVFIKDEGVITEGGKLGFAASMIIHF
jgi:hypothetical protein